MTNDLMKLMAYIDSLQSEPTPEPIIETEETKVHPLLQAMQELKEEGIVESVDAHTIYSIVQSGHREPEDFIEGDIGDRIYWFDDYKKTSLPISKLNLDEHYVDDDLVDDYVELIKSSPNTMPPLVFDPIANSIIDGIHRANAYAKLGYDTIPAYVGLTKSDTYGEREEIYEATDDIKDQIEKAIIVDGGNIDEYFVRSSNVDKIGYSVKQQYGRSPDLDHPDYDIDYIGSGVGKPALWFFPASYYLKTKDPFGYRYPYIWLVKLRPNAWLQPVDRFTKSIQNAPAGKERVGILKKRLIPAAIFFKPAFDVVDKFINYKVLHKPHGQVKGPQVSEELAYHGTTDDIAEFHPFTHFGTEKAAKDRIEYKKIKDGKIYKVDLDIKNPLKIKDFPGIHYDRLYAFELKDKGLISQEEMEDITFTQNKDELRNKLLNKLEQLGIDGFVYKNKYEDKGNISYVIVDPSQVKVLGVEPATEAVAEEYTFAQKRRQLNIPELIKRGAFYITHPHGPDGWETDRPDWDFSLITLQNILQKSPEWSTEYKKYIRPESYSKATQEFFSKLSDQKYNQILWSIKKLGIPDDVAFLDKIDEASPNTLEGSFTPDLVESKTWLAKMLAKGLKGKNAGTIYVLGSWYGNMGIFLQQADVKFDKLVLIEPNEDWLMRSKDLLDTLNDEGKLILIHQKAEDVVYEKPGVVINTSCNETGPVFLTKLPDNMLCLLQARNNVDNVLIETDNLEEFKDLFSLNKIYYAGEKHLTDPETDYTRYMIIGRTGKKIDETVSTGLGGGSAGANGAQMVGGPTTYEQEYNMFKRKGPRRITAMTNEEEIFTELLTHAYKYYNPNPNTYYFDNAAGEECIVEFSRHDGSAEVIFAVDGETRLTGKGDSYKIISTVVDIIKDYLNKTSPKKLTFSADNSESARVKLYSALATKVSDSVPNYELDYIQKGRWDTYFRLIRTDGKIVEALDSSYPYEGKAISGRYTFETEDGVFYKVYFQGKDLVEIAFSAILPGEEENFRPDKTTITGTGNSRKVFGTVVKIVQEYVDAHKPKALYFISSDEPSRLRLYQTMTDQVGKALPDYYAVKPTDLGDGKAFMLKRKTDKVNEALDSSYDYRPGNKQGVFYFDTEDGSEYKVSLEGDKKHVYVSFYARGQGDEHKVGLTGTGNSRKIFGTVINIVQNYINKAKPGIIAFSGYNGEPSRLKLYKMLASKVDTALPDYNFAEELSDGTFTTYYLTRNDVKVPAFDKIKAAGFKALDKVFEDSITLNKLYSDNKPHRDDTIWDYGTMIWDNEYPVETINPNKLNLYLQSQYSVEHVDELFDMMGDEEQQEIVMKYVNDPNLSDSIIVLDNGYIVDGNHRALAAVLANKPIKYIDIGETDESS